MSIVADGSSFSVEYAHRPIDARAFDVGARHSPMKMAATGFDGTIADNFCAFTQADGQAIILVQAFTKRRDRDRLAIREEGRRNSGDFHHD